MASIDDIRELAFYLLRKLNDFLLVFNTELPPPHQPPNNEEVNAELQRLHMVFDNNPYDIDRRIRRIRRSLNEEPTLRPPPTTPIETTTDEQDDDSDRRIREIRRSLNEPTKSDKILIEMKKEINYLEQQKILGDNTDKFIDVLYEETDKENKKYNNEDLKKIEDIITKQDYIVAHLHQEKIRQKERLEWLWGIKQTMELSEEDN